jgi:cell division septum initiation protein DivIVA
MSITPAMRATVPEDVLVQELQGESVLLNVRSGRYFGLDEVGTRLWAVLTTTESVGAACEALAAEYDVEPARLRADIEALVARLAEHGLVELRGA